MAIALENPIRSQTQQWRDATWQDYENLRDRPDVNWQKIAFDQGWLWVDLGKAGPNHARFRDLLTGIFGFWAFLHPDLSVDSLGSCLIEKPEIQACVPDLVLYHGKNIPRWQLDDSQKIDLNRYRVPDLVGEIADTSLSLDLDEQKRLYASLQIPEYWVIDVKGLRLFAFGLTAAGVYEEIEVSRVLAGLEIALVCQTLERLITETNTAAANWLTRQLQEKRDSLSERQAERSTSTENV